MMLAKAMIVVAIIGVAVSALAESAAIIKDNCTHLVADVWMSADSVAAGRVDGVADRVSRIEANQTICQSKQDGRLRQLESSLSRIDDVVDSRVDERCEKKIGDLRKLADGFYEVRYRGLKEDHDRFMDQLDKWLTVIGILVALLGVAVPLVMSVLQRCEAKRFLRQARADVRRIIHVSSKANQKELDLIRSGSVKALHMATSESFVIVDLLGSGQSDKAMLVSSAIMCVHELFESAMRTGDAKVVANEIAAVRAFVTRWADSDDGNRKKVWSSACQLAKSAISKSAESCRRFDYDRVLGVESESFKWLESFYRGIADWKFA